MTPFDDWLRRLAAAQLLIDKIPPAFRGLAWEQPVEIEGDWPGATLEGTVSRQPGPASAETFEITGPVVADGFSTWTASLTAGDTESLFSTNDGDGDGIVELAAMFRLTPSGGTKAVLIGGTFTVMEQA